jgi:hypothetical protein
MNKIKKALMVLALTVLSGLAIAAPIFAAGNGLCDGRYNLIASDKATNDFTVSCGSQYVSAETASLLNVNNKKAGPVNFYGKSQSDCARLGTVLSASDPCSATDLNSTIRTIINGITFVVGLIAVIMIIIGGIFYAISAGDPGKVKKAKDTIMYGIIGLIVALLAFAIINFVLQMVQG